MNAISGRDDYDQVVKIATFQPGEPYFVVRAGDAVSAATVRAWAALAHQAGAPVEAVEMALQQADVLEAWPTKKVPDGPDITPNARLSLRAQFAGRAWMARETAPAPTIALAEQRGVSAVLGRLRPLLTDLLAHLDVVQGAEASDGSQADLIDAFSSAGPVIAQIYAIAGQDLAERLKAAKE